MLLLLFVTLLSTEIFSTQVYVCENKTARISCPPLQDIHINNANYGRTSRLNCPNPRYDNNTQCRSNNSTNILRIMCEGEETCTVSASNKIFGDPCSGIYKYLEVDFNCVSRRQTVCYGDTLTLTCPSFNVIKVITADLGRHNTVTCSYPNANQNTNCSLNQTSTVAKKCNGLQQCSVNVGAQNFPIDPCPGIFKYLDVNYTCEQQPEPINREQIACYDKTLTLSCPAPRIIRVQSADFGRHSTTICPYPGADSNTQCSMNQTNKVAQRCNGISSCTLNVNQQEFPIDPCYGTYKYLDVNYTCPLPPTYGTKEQFTCYDNTLNISCPSLKDIKVLSADFGRRSKAICSYTAEQNTQCSLNETVKVAQKCNGLRNCILNVNKQEFPTDPCVGTYKYLDVNYTCQFHLNPNDIKTQITCYDTKFSISCSSSEIIKVVSADFGRHSPTICPLAGAVKDTQCSLDSTSKMALRCNGLQTCTMNVDQQEFSTDPCYGTYKYLTVNYVCQSAPYALL